MADKTGIEWADATWNPLVGCSAVSPGCDHCYAARESAGRLKHLPVYSGLTDRHGQFNGIIRMLPERLLQPYRWKRPRRIFVNSMSDLFHRDVDYEFVAKVFAAMALAPQHHYLMLTKRPHYMVDIVNDTGGLISFQSEVRLSLERLAPDRVPSLTDLWAGWPLPQVWLGTSIESNRYVWRANHLRATEAAVRWLSLEPLLGPLPDLDLTGIDWVVVGGESGPGARPMHPQWVRDIRDRCLAEGVPFLFKQWGEYRPAAIRDDDSDQMVGGRVYDNPRGGTASPAFRTAPGQWRLMRPGERRQNGDTMLDDDTIAIRLGKKRAGRTLDGRTWDQFPLPHPDPRRSIPA